MTPLQAIPFVVGCLAIACTAGAVVGALVLSHRDHKRDRQLRSILHLDPERSASRRWSGRGA